MLQGYPSLTEPDNGSMSELIGKLTTASTSQSGSTIARRRLKICSGEITLSRSCQPTIKCKQTTLCSGQEKWDFPCPCIESSPAHSLKARLGPVLLNPPIHSNLQCIAKNEVFFGANASIAKNITSGTVESLWPDPSTILTLQQIQVLNSQLPDTPSDSESRASSTASSPSRSHSTTPPPTSTTAYLRLEWELWEVRCVCELLGPDTDPMHIRPVRLC